MRAASKKKSFYIVLGIGLTLLTLFLFFGRERLENIKKVASLKSPESVKIKDWIQSALTKRKDDILSPPLSEQSSSKEKDSKTSEENLREIFDKEDACNLVKLDAYQKEEIVSYFTSKDTAILLEFIKKGESLEGRSFRGNPLIETFIRALYYSGLIISGEGNSAIEKDKADPLWEELYTKDPDNGAIDFYYMSYQSKLGQKPESLVKYVIAMTEKPKFENYYFDLTRSIYEDSLRGPAHYLVGIGVTSQLPITDPLEAYNILIKIVKTTTDEKLKKSISEWAHQQISIPKKHQGGLEMVEWSILDLALSSRLLKKLGEKGQDYEAFIDSRIRKERNQFEQDALTDIYNYENKGCNTSKLEEIILRQKELYEKARRLFR